MVGRRNSLETQEPGAVAPQQEHDDGEWVSVRDAAKDAGLSVPRIYQLAYGPEPPFKWKPYLVGHIRHEIRIKRDSLTEYIARREAEKAAKASAVSAKTQAPRQKIEGRPGALAA